MNLFKKIFGNKPKPKNGKDIPENEQLENPTELLMVKLFFEDKPILNDELIEKELKNRFEIIEFPETSDKTENSKIMK